MSTPDCKDQIKEALVFLSTLRALARSQANLHMPPLRLSDSEFQCFSVLIQRIQAWLEGMRLSVPVQEQASRMPDCEAPKIEPAGKDS